MRNIYITLILLAALSLTACTSTSSPSNNLTTSEVAKHNSASDCWLIISGKVYNVTSYVGSHPGGDIILQGCGKDATQLFATQGGEGEGHSSVAQSLLKSFYVGDLTK